MDTRQEEAGRPVIPTPHNVGLAEASCRFLAQHLPPEGSEVQLRLVDAG